MKKKLGKFIYLLLVCIAAVMAVTIGIIYFSFISDRIYEDSTKHLEELYRQVNSAFGSFAKSNWGLLESWDKSIDIERAADDEAIADFIEEQQSYWGFSEFYFLSKDKKCMTPDGIIQELNTGDTWELLMEEGKPVIAEGAYYFGHDVTLFAVPVPHGEYKGFGFDAISVSYTNADMAKSLNVSAYSGEAICFVVKKDGSVLLSTRTGGNVFENCLLYLKAVSDLDEDAVAKIQNDWEVGNSGVVNCNIGDISYCILYQPVGFQDFILLSAVPRNVVSAGFLSVQKTTTNVLIVIFTLIGAAAMALILLHSRGVSQKNRAELQYRELMFDVLSNSVDDIFIMINEENHHVDYISPNVERLLGVSSEEVSKNIRCLEKCAINLDVVIPKEIMESIPINKSRYWEWEYMHQTTGERRWYRLTMYHMSLQDVRKYIVVMSDRTHEQQMNQQLQDALTAVKSANEAKSNFLANMSHDIRTPMNAIVGLSVLLEKDADNADKVREYTRKITSSSHHLLSLINDVLDMSKIESGKTSLNVDCFELPELLKELNIILMPQAKAKRQTFTTHVVGTPPEKIIGDRLRLNQILINLLSNSIKYTPDEGRIEFTVSEVSTSAQYTKLRFVVRDNGIGMSEDYVKQIFVPFSREVSSMTNKIQGTGLGMAITKNLVDLMGGIILVESKPGEGSTFTVELSFSLPEAEDEDEAWLSSNISHMLVVDDEEDICLNIKALMKNTGVDVVYVTEGAAAVDAALKAHNEGNDFDVILIDWKMPDSDGVDTARKIRSQIGAAVPIMVLTSYDWGEIETEARAAGINAFMPKPFFLSTFRQIIKPLLEEYSGYNNSDEEVEQSVLAGLMFLVAEDNELNAEIITAILEMEGAGCELAENGAKAVEMFEKSEPGHYDMILMDVQMPVMNGEDAARKIRMSQHPDAAGIPIAAMTANTFSEDVRRALDSGMNAHLAKPIDMNALRETVEQLINKH